MPPALQGQPHSGDAMPPPFGVIDIGATAIRLMLAQVNADGTVTHLESLQQAISLGKDSFATGYISPATIEQCVKCLGNFRQVLAEYQIPLRRGHLRAVATSAVSSASNRDTLIDRIYIATGIEVEPVDEAEIIRFTYLSLLPFESTPVLAAEADNLVIEVGGGSTEVLALHQKRFQFIRGYQLGSLRLRQQLEEYNAPALKLRELMESQISRTVQDIRRSLREPEHFHVIAMGGDARFAASLLKPGWESQGWGTLSVTKLETLTHEILRLSVDDLVRTYHLNYPEAETLGPALLIYLRLAQILEQKSIFVTTATMRDGVLAEMSTQDVGTERLRPQVLQSVMTLARKYQVDQQHADTVRRLSQKLFRALQTEHNLSPKFELLLTAAAVLHDIGNFVAISGHHKHSMYLVRNSDIFGLSPADVDMVALCCRYHRRALPRPSHPVFSSLDRDQRINLVKMAAILRVADALDRGHNRRITDVDVRIAPDKVVLQVRNVTDLTLEQLALAHKGDLFEQVYGKTVVLQIQKDR